MLEHAVAPQYINEEGTMPVDYVEVLKELKAQEKALQDELDIVRGALPAIEKMATKALQTWPPPPPTVSGKYSSMYATEAIPDALKGEVFPLTTSQIADKVKAGGLRSTAQNFVASVSATLSQLKERNIVEKVGDGWRLKAPPPPFEETPSVIIGSIPAKVEAENW
jgi:hypothetical protein